MTGTPLYNVWAGMKQRCYYEKHIDYQWYQANNITVCDEWRTDFMAFYRWAMDNGYHAGLTVDRIDNTKGYSPDNCRLATPEEQACNRRSNLNYTYDGRTQTLKQWAKELGINYGTLYYRVRISDYSFEDAISHTRTHTPTRQTTGSVHPIIPIV